MKGTRIFVAISAALLGGAYFLSCSNEIELQDSQELAESESARVSEEEMVESNEGDIDSSRCITTHGGRIGVPPTGRTRINRRHGRR